MPIKPSLLLYSLVVAFAVASTGCVNREAQQQAKKTQEILSDKSTLVEVREAKVESLVDEIEISGQITTEYDASVGAKVGARITAVYVKDGDAVGAGQAIAQQDTGDLMTQVRQAQGSVDAARAQVRQAQEEAAQGPVRSSAAVKASEARVRQARSTLEKIRKGARDEERRQSQAAVNAARSNMETAKRDLQRDEELLKQGAISPQEADRSRNQYQAALSQYEQSLEAWRIIENGARTEDVAVAQQELRAAEEALRADRAQQRLDVQFRLRVDSARGQLQVAQEQLTLAQSALRDATIRSPFNGTVSGKTVQAGTFVGPGTPVARVIGSGAVYFEGEVPESRLSLITPGREVRVTTVATGAAPLQGEVLAINPIGSSTGRLFRARIGLKSAPESVKPGMFARGKIEVDRIDDAILVPTTAILRSGETTFVYVAEGSTAKRRTVKVLKEQMGRSQVDGLPVGAQVVIKGQDQLAEGSPIKIATASGK